LQGRRQSPVSVRIGKLDPGFAAFASASGNTLTIWSHTINIDGRALSHDLFPIGIAGPNTFLPRATVDQLTIIPAAGYGFQPGSGIVADLNYGIGRDVAIGVYVRPNAPARLTPQGNVTFTVGNTLLGGANRPFPAAFAWMYRAAGGLAVCRRNGLRDRMTNVI
jgi:hypothetical protein